MRGVLAKFLENSTEIEDDKFKIIISILKIVKCQYFTSSKDWVPSRKRLPIEWERYIVQIPETPNDKVSSLAARH